MSLTKNAILKMLSQKQGVNKLFTLEGSRVGKTKGKFISLFISDGQQTSKAIIEEDRAGQIHQQHLDKNDTFKLMIHQYATYAKEKKTIIQILDFTMIKDPSISIIKKQPTPTIFIPKFEDGSKIVRKDSSIKFESAQLLAKAINPSKNILRLIQQDYQQTKPHEQNQINDIDIRSFQKIEDLYQGIHAWELLVRVIDKSYRQFISKQGKEIKILTIQLIDKAGYLIEGSFFGDQAQHYNTTLQKGKIYRIARGKISQNTFMKNKKVQKYSKYVIKFNFDSSIIEVRDFPQIPYYSVNWYRISQINDKISEFQQLNFISIIVKIEEQRSFMKENKQIIMQELTVGDPVTNNTISLIIWNRQLKIDSSFLNKSALLKHFKVTKYKDALNLCSTYRSEIIKHSYFSQYQQTWRPYFIHNESLFEPKLLKTLDEQLKNIEKQVIISDLNVWVISIGFGLKWYYDSCPNPKCKKSATDYTICESCSFPIQECTKRFILTVQLSDFTGSIYLTAFQEVASIFLNHQSIQSLLILDDNGRKNIGDKLAFANYRIKISTKKDGTGKIKHTIVGKPQLVDCERQIKDNLILIKKMKNQPVQIA